jgi:hypothetical protein
MGPDFFLSDRTFPPDWPESSAKCWHYCSCDLWLNGVDPVEADVPRVGHCRRGASHHLRVVERATLPEKSVKYSEALHF